MREHKKTVLYLAPKQIEWLARNKQQTGLPMSVAIRLALDAYIKAAEQMAKREAQ